MQLSRSIETCAPVLFTHPRPQRLSHLHPPRWYNSAVPTPFYHLNIALDLLDHPQLAHGLKQQIQRHMPAYLLGHTAPDVQVVSGQKRVETHFFEVPIPANARQPWEQLLIEYPGLQHTQGRSTEQYIFLAGYLCHLQADWLWARQIYQPIFGPVAAWENFRQRQYLHNVLRSYLDFQVLHALNGRVSSTLPQAVPNHWLPFTGDEYLIQWRDLLAEQFQPGARVQTVEVFATRQGIAAEKYYQLLSSEIEMDQQIFLHIPRQHLISYKEKLLAENLQIIETYLKHPEGG
jgi:hypothetical protein